MAVGNWFEKWACEHVMFDMLNDVWPYLLEDKFGNACLERMALEAIPQFNERDCLWIALHLELPVILDDLLPIPLNLTVPNPIGESEFQEFRIQTVRNSLDDNDVVPFVADDDPFDEEFGERYFALYGADSAGRLEHIADRKLYGELLKLAEKLAPGIGFPCQPIFGQRRQ